MPRVQLKFDKEINSILDEYSYNSDIFNEEEETTLKLKKIINTKLSDVEKRLIVLYIDTQSFRKVASMMDISASTCYNYINNIRKKIKSIYEST